MSALRFCESVEKTHSNHDTSALVAAELGITAPPLRIDSQCKYAVLARGDAEVYLRLPAKAKSTYVEFIWDHAAGELLTPSKRNLNTTRIPRRAKDSPIPGRCPAFGALDPFSSNSLHSQAPEHCLNASD